MVYRTSEKEKVLKDLAALDEEAQQELYDALNQTFRGLPLADYDPDTLRVTQQTLKERLELQASEEKITMEKKPLYQRPITKILVATTLVGALGYVVSRISTVRDLYDHSPAYQKARAEDHEIYSTRKKLEEMIDRNCTGEVSGGEFLEFYKIATGSEINNRAILNTINNANDSYLKIQLSKEATSLRLNLDYGDFKPKLTVTMSPEMALKYVAIVKEKEGNPCSMELK